MDPLELLQSGVVGRRAFLKGGGMVGSALVSASLFGKAVKQVYGAPIVVPKEVRTIEAGLAAFTLKWEVAGPVIVLTRFGRFLSNKTFNLRVADDPRTYNLTLGAVGAAFLPGLNPFANATLVMTAEAWTDVLFGDFVGLGAFLASEAYASRDDQNKAVLLAILFYVFAHIPAGANPDPDLFLSILRGLAERRGLPSCAGEPSELEALDDLRANPTAILLPKATPPPVTKNLADWVAGLGFSSLSSDAVKAAKVQLKSILAAMYAGSQMAPAAKTAAAVLAFGDRADATVVRPAGNVKTSARSAALANSVAAQVLEWEDWTFLSHSGASIVPVALAAGERSAASGAALLTAIVAGNEILARGGEFLTDVVHTGNALTIHQLELPLVAGKLLGLDAAGLQDALGIACVQPQVTSIPSWTADAKGMLTGWPATVAVTAADLAAAGVSGRRDILENPLGYFASVSDFAGPEKLAVFDDLPTSPGGRWRFWPEHFTKRYPTDGFQLTSVHAAVKLVTENAIDPAAVSEILVRIPLVMAGSATMFSRESPVELLDKIRGGQSPDWTYITLLFDGYYPVAAATVRKRLTWREYLPDALNDPTIASLLPKIRLEPDLSMGVFGATVKITAAGQSYESFVACIREDVNGQSAASGDYQGDWTPDVKLATGVGLDGVAGDPPPIRTAAQLQTLIEVIDDLEHRSVAELISAL